MKTHYDNLQVSRAACPEVIRAAYRALADKYEPSRHDYSPEAQRISKLLDVAFGTLSSPERRAEHDRWILSEAGPAAPRAGSVPIKGPVWGLGRKARIAAAAGAVVLIFGAGWATGQLSLATYHKRAHRIIAVPVEGNPFETTPSSTIPPPPPGYVIEDQPSGEAAQEPWAHAPDGRAWPTQASYVPGAPKLRTNGRSSLTIDTAANEGNIFAKLVALDGAKPQAIRSAFIPAGASFKLGSIPNGRYAVQYRDLSSGNAWAVDDFEIEPDARHTERMTIELMPRPGGNLDHSPISDAEFAASGP